MPLSLSDFQESSPGTYSTRVAIYDGHPQNVHIHTGGGPLEDASIQAAQVYLDQEASIRREAAAQLYGENDWLRDELGYASADEFHDALVTSGLTVMPGGTEIQCMYFSPLDDLERNRDKHVVLVCLDRETGERDIYLEHIPDW